MILDDLVSILLALHVVLFEIEFSIESNICLLRLMSIQHLSRLTHQQWASLHMLVGHHLIRFKVGHHPSSKQGALKPCHLLGTPLRHPLIEIRRRNPHPCSIVMGECTLDVGISDREGDDRAADLEGVGELLLQREHVLQEDQSPELRPVVLDVDAVRLIFDDCMGPRY